MNEFEIKIMMKQLDNNEKNEIEFNDFINYIKNK